MFNKDDILNGILNKKNDSIYYTGTVSTLNPLSVKLYPGDDEIPVVETTGLVGVSVGSRLLLIKFQNQLIAVAVIGPAFKNDFIEIIMSTVGSSYQYVTTTNDTKILFDYKTTQTGSLLSYTSNGVKIGKGIKKIKVNLQCWGQRNSTTAYFAMFIYKNSSRESYSIFPDRDGSSTADTYTTLHNTRILEVSEDDMIYGYGKFSVADASNAFRGDYHRSTMMQVQVLEYE